MPHCVDCDRPMRPWHTSVAQYPGTVTRNGVRCTYCATKNRGTVREPKKPRSAVCERCGIVEIVSSSPRARKWALCRDCRGVLSPAEREAWAA